MVWMMRVLITMEKLWAGACLSRIAVYFVNELKAWVGLFSILWQPWPSLRLPIGDPWFHKAILEDQQGELI
jgi:hypothetical protein